MIERRRSGPGQPFEHAVVGCARPLNLAPEQATLGDGDRRYILVATIGLAAKNRSNTQPGQQLEDALLPNLQFVREVHDRYAFVVNHSTVPESVEQFCRERRMAPAAP
jgi:hypothetical protein